MTTETVNSVHPMMLLVAQEEALVAELGERIGYGRTMQLCEKLWGQKLARMGQPAGGAHASYCCVTFLVRCPGCGPAYERGEHCEWCCGAGRVTKIVAKTIRKLARVSGTKKRSGARR